MEVVEQNLALSPRQPLNGQRVLRIPGLATRHKQNVKQKIKIGTLNVGTMTGKGREIVDLMERRKLEILCVQETRWKGNKARELGGGFKLIYSGANEQGRNGVGIILSSEHKDNIISVKRVNDRIVSVRLVV